jgi:hypothetical protein
VNTTQIGDITEQKIILYCLEHDVPILKPIGNNLPYDFVIDYNGELLKVQVKTCRKASEEVITFNTRSCSKNYSEIIQKDYVDRADYFVTIYNDKCLFVPVNSAAKGEHRIYIGENPKKSQHSYKEYLLF